MSKREEYEQKTEALVMPVIKENNFELVDVEFVKEGSNWYLRLYVDKEGGITIDDCELVSRQMSDILDREDYIDESYILEVSSPGLLRPFKKPRDYLRNIGEDVEMKLFSPVTWEEKGKKYSDKEFVGILKEYREEDGTIVLAMDDREMEVQVKDIALIRKYITF